MSKPILWIIVPCYNEEAVLPITAPLFLQKLTGLIAAEKVAEDSRILFVNDGSKDKTWEIICNFARSDEHFLGIAQSRNRGHQNALLAGLMEAKDRCDIVYGVRSSRKKDSWFKRTTAQSFYRLMSKMGVEMVYDHADYRLVSAKVLRHFADFREVNIFLRGMFPLVGFRSGCVYYERHERMAGESHYPLKKMIAFAIEGITSLSVKPLTLIVVLGLITCLLGFIGIIWAIVEVLLGNAVTGWASTVCIILFLGGVQLLSIGVIGQYVGKIYLETKHRPRYIVSERTWTDED